MEGLGAMWAGAWWTPCTWTMKGAKDKIRHWEHSAGVGHQFGGNEDFPPFLFFLLWFPLVSQNFLLRLISFFSLSSLLLPTLNSTGIRTEKSILPGLFAFGRNTGVYKYSHAAISDPQLRDWTSGWAVRLFDHEACTHASLWMKTSSSPPSCFPPSLSSSLNFLLPCDCP